MGGAAPREGVSSSAWASVANITNCAIGAGMLAFPFAFSCSGLLSGLVLCLLTCFISATTLKILIDMSFASGISTYEGLVQRFLGRRTATFVSALIVFFVFGGCTGFLIISEDTFTPLWAQAIGEDHPLACRQFVVTALSLFVLLPICLQRTMGALAYVSGPAVSVMVCTGAVVVGHAVYYLVTTDVPDPWADVVMVRASTDVFYVVPIMLFAFHCHINMVPIFYELCPHPTFNPLPALSRSLSRALNRNSSSTNCCDCLAADAAAGPSASANDMTNIIAAANRASSGSANHMVPATANHPAGGSINNVPGLGDDRRGSGHSREAAHRRRSSDLPPAAVSSRQDLLLRESRSSTIGPWDIVGGARGEPKVAGGYGVVAVGMTECMLLYCIVGVAGYLLYPHGVQADLMKNLPSDEWLMKVLHLAVGASVLLHYPVNAFTARTAMDDLLCKAMGIPPTHDDIHAMPVWRLALHTTTFLAACTFAASQVESLGMVFKLLGGLVGSTVVAILPGAMYISSAEMEHAKMRTTDDNIQAYVHSMTKKGRRQPIFTASSPTARREENGSPTANDGADEQAEPSKAKAKGPFSGVSSPWSARQRVDEDVEAPLLPQSLGSPHGESTGDLGDPLFPRPAAPALRPLWKSRVEGGGLVLFGALVMVITVWSTLAELVYVGQGRQAEQNTVFVW